MRDPVGIPHQLTGVLYGMAHELMGYPNGVSHQLMGNNNTVPSDLMLKSEGTVFSDLSVKSIVIPPASTGTTAISRAAVQS